jgi:hypothetical protein
MDLEIGPQATMLSTSFDLLLICWMEAALSSPFLTTTLLLTPSQKKVNACSNPALVTITIFAPNHRPHHVYTIFPCLFSSVLADTIPSIPLSLLTTCDTSTNIFLCLCLYLSRSLEYLLFFSIAPSKSLTMKSEVIA